jgi:hypothetical protein
MPEFAEWNEPDPAILDDLVHWSIFAADTVVIDGRRMGRFPTPAEETRAAVKAAIRLLLANGVNRCCSTWFRTMDRDGSSRRMGRLMDREADVGF